MKKSENTSLRKITRKTPIEDILKIHPQTRFVLMAYGLNCMGCGFSKRDTLEFGLKAHGLEHEIKNVLRDLNNLIKRD